MGVCNCSMFCFTLLYVHSSFAIILMEKRELVSLLSLSSWYLVMVVWLFIEVPWLCLRFVFVVFPDHTHLLFLDIYVCQNIKANVSKRLKPPFLDPYLKFYKYSNASKHFAYL